MSQRVQITNGKICGCTQIGVKLAIRMISAGDAVIDGNPDDFKIRLTFNTLVHRPARDPDNPNPRPVKDSHPTPAIHAVQNELVYQGRRREGSPVTGSVLVLRKVRGKSSAAAAGNHLQFKSWGETDKFPRKRFNPDLIPAPLFHNRQALDAARTKRATAL